MSARPPPLHRPTQPSVSPARPPLQLSKPGRVSVSSCAYSIDGRLIAGGLADGTIQMWDVRGKFGHSAAVGVVPQPKPQQVLQPKQTWTYASAPGAQHFRGVQCMLTAG